MDKKIHRYPLKILESHLDSYGHVNNSVYLKIFEEARWDLITANGYGYKEIQETGLGPTILEVNVQFRRELRLRQEVVIETSVLSSGKKLAVIYQEIKDPVKDSVGDSGKDSTEDSAKDFERKVYCIARFTFGLFDIRARKLVSPTPQWLKAIGLNPESNS